MRKKIPGFEHYTIDELGVVINTETGKTKKNTLGKVGYFYVDLYKNKKNKKMYIHRLLAQLFIPNPENKPEVNHKDGVKTNNSLDNLEWVTRSENTSHAYKIGLNQGSKVLPQSEAPIIYRRFKAGETLAKICESYPVVQSCLTEALKKYTKANNLQKEFEDIKKDRHLQRTKNRVYKHSKPIIMLDKDTKKELRTFKSPSEAAKFLGKTTSGPISNVLTGRTKTGYGFKWEYAERP